MKNYKIVLLVFFVLSLCIRLFFVFFSPSSQKNVEYDAAQFDTIGWNIALGRGFSLDSVDIKEPRPTNYRPPLYPLFLGICYRIFGHNYLYVRIIQAILASFMVLVLYKISSMIFDPKAGIIALVMSTFYPPFISYLYYGGANFLLAELLFMFFLALTMLWMVNFAQDGKAPAIIIAAIFLALTTLIKPILTLYFLFVIGWIFSLYKNNIRVALCKTGIFLSVFLLTLSPWILRNYFVFDKVILVNTQFGIPFWCGNNSAAKGGMLPTLKAIPEYRPEEFIGLDDIQSNKKYIQKAIEYLLNHKQKIPYLFFKKILVHWNVFNEENKYNLAYAIVASFALIGILFSFRKKAWRVSVLVLLLLYSTVIAITIGGDPRYRYVVEPFLIVIASGGIFYILKSAIPMLYKVNLIGFILGANFIIFIFYKPILHIGKIIF